MLASRTPRASAGFSLIELVVVIGIIAVLLGILLPVISKARESARTIGCLSNMRQLVAGSMLYSSAYDGFILPAEWFLTTPAPKGSPPISPNAPPLNANESWCNILVNGGYMSAPNSLGRGPQTNSIFFCPSGEVDVSNLNSSVFNQPNTPSNRTNGLGEQAIRYYSVSHANTVDCWYGINADLDSLPDMTAGPPCRRVGNVIKNQGVLDLIHKSSQMVMFYDGIFAHLQYNPNRINARHGGQKKTNLAFFDGHAETFETASLPGGLTAPSSAFLYSNLSAYPSPPNPMWLIEQQK